MIAIVGSEGSMGKRYQAILTHESQAFLPLDLSTLKEDAIIKKASTCDRIILCTPTDTHTKYLKSFLPLKKPLLCEKPVTKSLAKLIDLHSQCSKNGWSYNMVMQYKELDIPLNTKNRWSYYNYFRHGDDGLAWDCLQTIGLAQGPVWLKEDSPTWECTINGRALSIADMDGAYITMVRRWLLNSLDQSMDEILQIHQKVVAFQEGKAA